ncbi:MAG: LON peptidase substrate-binding domain-containing protein, partial [Pseudomonadota bacterium]|nr:LON peptidase substrate-binding domain-containing protein [Pseudomonadota bacterium]
MPETEQIPLFPLRVVMFPGGRLDLQIFERRYIDLVSHCMRTSTG